MRQLIGAGTPRETVAGGYGCIFVLVAPAGAILVAPIVLIVSEDGETAFAASCFAVGWNPVNGAFFNGLLRPKNASNAALPPSLLPMLWVTRG